MSLQVTSISFLRRSLASANLEGVDVGTVSDGVVGDVGSGVKTRVGRRRRKRWWGGGGWGIRLKVIKMMIDAGALTRTGDGDNGNGGDDDNDNDNDNGIVWIEVSLRSHGMDARSVCRRTQTWWALCRRRRRNDRVC